MAQGPEQPAAQAVCFQAVMAIPCIHSCTPRQAALPTAEHPLCSCKGGQHDTQAATISENEVPNKDMCDALSGHAEGTGSGMPHDKMQS